MHIEVTPTISTHGTAAHIHITDLAPGADCRLTLATTDNNGTQWSGTYTFTADEDGTVDTATSLPHGAEWVPADPLGPWWALSCEDNQAYAAPTKPTTVDISARTAGQPGVRTQIHRRPPTHATAVEQLPRCTGRGGGDTSQAACFIPTGTTQTGPWPLVILLGDATGTPPVAGAAHLAEHGYAVCAPHWVPADTTPMDLDRIESCLRGLRRLDYCDSDTPISLVGIGRGAELALMLAAAHPDLIGPVVAHSPTDVRTRQPGSRRQADTWTGHDYPTTAIAAPGMADAATDFKVFIHPDATGSPRKLADYYRSARQHSDLDAAAIDISTLSGPLLLTAGDDDTVWEAVASMDRLHEKARAAGIETFTATYHDCGYGVGYPFTLPSDPGRPLISLYGKPTAAGGSRAGRGRAAADSYTNTTTFLSSALGTDTTPNA